ncbi:hypothetical protein BJ508DRAFT_88068 [Ascobolus immersus RN42]|uniref:NACHT domain-containing protein n=1 Tax=Ascobolus immersus RN42 TaxID=1160509 RepID=A0A3N4HI23_ASCIM|nr:hypothetical protein BJ508DRAFT_88068 [Ascobolus immersus RN42]
MEGVGTAANLLAVINLAAKAAEIVYKYWQKAKNCPQEVYELYQLLVGAKSTNDHLQALEAKLREQQEANGEAVFAITQLRSKAMECERVIAGLVKNLGDELEDHGKGWRKLTKSKLKWPLKEGEVLAVKKTLEEYGKLFAMALAIDTAKMVLKVVDTTERIDREAIKKLEAERKSRLLKWLSPYLYDSKHQESREKYTEGTGHWVLEDPQILSWMENQGSKLWIYGIPGAGKTILASTIITHLESTRRAKDTLVAFFYCQYNREHANDPVRIARSILAQFLSLLDDQSLFRDFLGLFDCEERTQAPPESIDIILSLITDALSLYARAYVIVDGIDECSSDVRYKLLGFLRGLSKLESIHLLLVSRNEADIRSSFGGYSTMSLDGRPGLKDDMRIAVDLELGNEQKWGHLDKQLHLLIKETLIRDSGVNM